MLCPPYILVNRHPVTCFLLAFPLHLGHFTFMNFLFSSSGFPFPNLTFSGSFTGKSFSGTGTMPQESQYMMGIGVPQYLCLETSQSLNLYCIFLRPFLFDSNAFVTFSFASSEKRPLKNPELIKIPEPS